MERLQNENLEKQYVFQGFLLLKQKSECFRKAEKGYDLSAACLWIIENKILNYRHRRDNLDIWMQMTPIMTSMWRRWCHFVPQRIWQSDLRKGTHTVKYGSYHSGTRGMLCVEDNLWGKNQRHSAVERDGERPIKSFLYGVFRCGFRGACRKENVSSGTGLR